MAQDSIQTSPLLIWLENWVRDCRQSWRGLRKRPVFAFTAIASLAIGIGAVTSIYSVLDAVVWKPVALPGEQDLYVIREFKKGKRPAVTDHHGCGIGRS